MNTTQLRKILTDIRFWIIFLFALRLIGIMDAPLEPGHNWRQALTNMIARNFLENGANILYPTVDIAGEQSGIIGSEFPFFNYLIYLFSYFFDGSHWIGRLINLSVSSFGLYYFYKLLKNLINKQTAFNATIILGVSIWFAYSRKIMPDTFSVSLVLIGLYHAYIYLKEGIKSRLVYFFLFCTLGMLCKIPALSLFSVLFILPFIKEIDKRRKLMIYAVGALSFLIVCLWYFAWVPYLLRTYEFQLYFPKGIIEGIKEIAPLLPELAEKFYFCALHSYIALAFVLVGIVLLMKSKKVYLISAIGIITLVFILFIFKTGAVFPQHSYYIIPFSPVFALLAGFAIQRIPLKFQYIALALIAIEAIANQQHDFFIKDSEVYKLKLEKIADKYIPKNDLIIINGGQSPQGIYFSNRKGWTVENEAILTTEFVDSLTHLGAKHLIVDLTRIEQAAVPYKAVYADEHYSIYDLKK